MNEVKYWLALNQASFLSPKQVVDLVKHFGSASRFWKASRSEIRDSGIFKQKQLEKLIKFWENLDINKEWERVEALGIKILTISDEGYPANLKNIYAPPPVLYVKGSLDNIDTSIAVVGTRTPTAYGRAVAEEIARQLAKTGFVVVSGLARGIDTCVHRGVIETEGKTVAVLGSGIDVIYPPENRNLAHKICQRGALLSEFPLGTLPEPWRFPRRNRIISGMTLGTVVVEAREKSGALITANYALQEGREVFAVAGNIKSSFCRGPHKLIKEGAKLVENVEDILEEFPWLNIKNTCSSRVCLDTVDYKQLSGEERKVLEALPEEGALLDQLIEMTGLPSHIVESNLLFLEVKGLVERGPGNLYLRR